MPEELHGAIRARLGDADQRYTRGRQDLVRVLLTAGRPLTAAEVVEDSGLAQSSAYRNLTLLEANGIVHRITGSDEFARFELAEDLTEHHHHLICTECGHVADFTVSDQFERSLHAVVDAVTAETGFRPDQHRFDLLGRCADCG